MSNSPSDSWWQRPETYLYAWDFADESARFIPMDRAALARSSFLDQRIAADLSTVQNVPIAEVLSSTSGEPSAAPAFIFHTAFCCSTLLARSLDLPGRTLALREPATLLQLADLKRGLTVTNYNVASLLTPTLNLLSRPFRTGERVLIKPTNLVNNLIPELLAASPESRVLVLYDNLEAFLLSVLKRPRESERGISQFLERLRLDAPARAFAPEVLNVGDLPRRAALVWALQMHALNASLSTSPSHVRFLGAPSLLREPVSALAAVTEWLNLGIDTAVLRDVTQGPIWNRHAKHPDQSYTPARRNEEQTLARRLLADPLQQTRAWMAQTPGLMPTTLPRALHLMD
ncbi:MAG: hypothetical protein ACRETC_03610 [Gammaproteobacteria bacterium]